MSPLLKSTLFDLTSLIMNYYSYDMTDHIELYAKLVQPFQFRAIIEYLIMKIESIEPSIDNNYNKTFESIKIKVIFI